MLKSRWKRRILLVNPWIHDFAAHDFWHKPLGLLYIGAILDRLGYEVNLLDCMDRFNPEWQTAESIDSPQTRRNGSGKYFRAELPKPEPLAGIRRRFCRYGAPRERVEDWLLIQPRPDLILMTSFMTYWYPGVLEMAELLRAAFPQTPLVLGGIYATLCPDHARRVIQPDHLVTGEGEKEAVRLVSQLCSGPGADFDYGELDELPYPWFHGYPDLASIAMLTSRGCPYRCSYCASACLAPQYRRRQPAEVFAEIGYWHETRGVENIAFFDDALLHQAEHYAMPLLRMIVASGYRLAIHTPNGVQPRCIDAEMAELLYGAGTKNLRLSYESSNTRHQQGKVTTGELATALTHLHGAGFTPGQIGVYLLAGLPGQEINEVRASIRQVHDLGARVNLASYSPIPGTQEFARSLKSGAWEEQTDLVLTNNSIYPFWQREHQHEELEALNLWVKQLNQSLLSIDEE
jgi:hypothetical protein